MRGKQLDGEIGPHEPDVKIAVGLAVFEPRGVVVGDLVLDGDSVLIGGIEIGGDVTMRDRAVINTR